MPISSAGVGSVRPSLSSSSLTRPSPSRRHSDTGSVNSSLCGDRDRRELHLASQNLSRDAGEQRAVLQLEKQNTALHHHVRECDEQLERTKAELRKARVTIQQYERQDEGLKQRLEQAQADKVRAEALAQEASERARKLDAKLAVGLHQRGMGAIQREAKAAEALRLLKVRDDELAAVRKEAALLRQAIEAREEQLGLANPRSSGKSNKIAAGQSNRESVLLQLQTLKHENASLRGEVTLRSLPRLRRALPTVLSPRPFPSTLCG